jgi:DNA-binding LacI/PurR family transcriptional regulator
MPTANSTTKLAKQTALLNLPVMNVWMSSPAWQLLPGVFPDSPSVGRLRAEHLLARGFRRFAGLTTSPKQ